MSKLGEAGLGFLTGGLSLPFGETARGAIDYVGNGLKNFASDPAGHISQFWDRVTGRDIQRETLDYQKWYDANKYQLTGADMAAAGLSKTLSAGSGQSTAVQSQQGVNQLNGIMSILSTISQIKGVNADAAYKEQQAVRIANDNQYYAEHGYFPDSDAAAWQQKGALVKEALTTLDNRYNIKEGVMSYSQDVKERVQKSTLEAAEKAARIEKLKSSDVVGNSTKMTKEDFAQRGEKLPGSNHRANKNVPIYQRGGR